MSPGVAEKPNVRTAEAEVTEEVFEVELPEGIELKGSEPEGETTDETTEEAQPEAKAKDKPQPRAEKKKDDRLPASTREERTKRQALAKKYEDVAAERDRLEAELRGRRAPQTVGMSKEYREALVDRGNKAETMGQLVEIFLDEQHKRDQMWSVALDEERFNRHLQVSETVARTNVDREYGRGTYDRVLREAGIKDAVQVENNGAFRDPALAKNIYGDRDPGVAAFELALGKLEKEGRLDAVLKPAVAAKASDEPDDEVDEEPEPKPKARKAATEEDAAGERRAGAREVIDRVAGHSAKPRGLHAVKPSAPPKRGLTRADLDSMSEKDPNGMKALFKVNPKLKDWWLGGVEQV